MTSVPAPLSKEEETKVIEDFLQNGRNYTVNKLKEVQKKLKLPIKGRLVKAQLFSKILEFLAPITDNEQPTNSLPSDPDVTVHEPQDLTSAPYFQLAEIKSFPELVAEAIARVYGDDNDFPIQISFGFASITIPKQYHFTSKADQVGTDMAEYKLVHETVKEHQTRDQTKFKFTGECRPQMKSITNLSRKAHAVRVDIDASRTLVSGYCSCLVGVCGSCKHTKALVKYVNNEKAHSCTTKEKVWGGPKSIDPKGQPVVGGIVPEKEIKCQVLPVDLHPLIVEYLLDLDSPKIELFKLKHNIK